jgi:hypothetical protein
MTSITTSLSLRSNLRVSGAIAPYTVLGISPHFVADFVEEEYVRNAGGSTFANAITHTRASTATMVDSDGALKWGPHNLHAHSDSPADWVVKQQITVFGNTLTATSTTAAHRIYDLSISSPSGASYIHNFEVSAGTHSYVQIHDGSSADYWANFDLSNGTVTVQTGSTASITQSGDKYICSMAFTSAVGSLLPILAIIPAANSTRNPSWTPVGTETVVLHRAWAYRSDLGGMVNNPERNDSYVPTTASAVYMPRRGHHVWNGSAWVNEGLLHESEARTNLALGSNTPSDTTYWRATGTQNGITHTVVGTGIENGAAYLDVQYAGTATSTFHSQLYIGTTTRTAASTGQTYVCALTGRVIDGTNPAGLGVSAGINQEIAPSTFVSTVSSGATGSFSRIDGNTDKTVFARITVSGSANQVYGFVALTFTNGETIDVTYRLKLFQFELGQMPSSFIPTSGSSVTRAADVLTIPAANLPWPSPVVIGPELVTNGTFDTDISGWTTVLGSASWSAGQISVARGGGGLGRVSAPITCEIGKVYRFTGYQDKGTTGSVTVTLAISSTSTVGAIAIFSSVTAGTFDLVFVATQTTHWVLLQNGSGSDGDAALFDNISVREINPLAVSIQMDGRVTYADEGNFGTVVPFRRLADSNNSIEVSIDTASAETGEINAKIRYLGTQFTNNFVGNEYQPDVLVPINISGRFGSNFVNSAKDGIADTAITTPTGLPDLSTADLNLGYDYNGTIRTFRIWAQDIGDAGLVEATEPSLVPSLSLTFDGTENSFVVLDWSE